MRSIRLALLITLLIQAGATAAEKPNIILVFTDDQGYGDIGCFGAKGFQTPNLDRLAGQGMRFTSFYSNCSVCSGSRAALLTGSHFQRVSIPPVMFPGNRNGLHPNEMTIAELLKQLGYMTAIIGKWHLGHLPEFLPTRQGFDYYFGIPYSNDMTIDPKNARLAKDIKLREDMTVATVRSAEPTRNWVPLMRGEEVIEYPADQTTLTQRYTEEAVGFIKKQKATPFFLYLPHTMPHLPMAVSEKFKGRTKSLFGDVIEEIDWSVGEIMRTLDELGIADNTLIIFTTDNGTRSGSSGPLRGQKATMYEGGFRVPCIMRWPGTIPEGRTCAEVAATIDILPTLAAITGAKMASARVIDGKSIVPLMRGEADAKSPHETLVFAHNSGAVRSGKWKFYPWREGTGTKKKAKETPKGPAVQLYDLSVDLGEKTNIAERHTDVVERLQAAYREHMEDLKKNRRPAGQGTGA